MRTSRTIGIATPRIAPPRNATAGIAPPRIATPRIAFARIAAGMLAFALLAAALLAPAPRALAHHSFPAQYDVEKPVTLTGKITKVEWTNPHIFIYIDVPNEESGEVVNWALEMGGPNSLLRLGWKRDSLQVGDVITAEGSLARDGSNLANARTIVMASTGRRMLAGSSDGTSAPEER